MAVLAERGRGSVAELFSGPVPCSAERGQQKTAEEDLFKEGCKGDAEGEEQPSLHGGLEELFDGRICRAGHQHSVGHGEYEAGAGCAKEPIAQEQGCFGIPLQAGKEALVPHERKNQEAGGKGDKIENHHVAQRVMNVLRGLFSRRDAVEMKV
jgi:hypothetical protein